MPSPILSSTEVDKCQANLEELLRRHGGLQHLAVRKHGTALVLYTLVDQERVNEARLTAVSRTRWRLDMPLHTGKWQATPFEGSMAEVFATLTNELAPFISPLE